MTLFSAEGGILEKWDAGRPVSQVLETGEETVLLSGLRPHGRLITRRVVFFCVKQPHPQTSCHGCDRPYGLIGRSEYSDLRLGHIEVQDTALRIQIAAHLIALGGIIAGNHEGNRIVDILVVAGQRCRLLPARLGKSRGLGLVALADTEGKDLLLGITLPLRYITAFSSIPNPRTISLLPYSSNFDNRFEGAL